MKTLVSRTYRVEPHHPEDPDGQGEVDDQDDEQQQDEQVEAALPPAINANLVDMVGHRPGHAAALGGGDVLLPHHLLPGHKDRHMLKKETDISLRRRCYRITIQLTTRWLSSCLNPTPCSLASCPPCLLCAALKVMCTVIFVSVYAEKNGLLKVKGL